MAKNGSFHTVIRRHFALSRRTSFGGEDIGFGFGRARPDEGLGYLPAVEDRPDLDLALRRKRALGLLDLTAGDNSMSASWNPQFHETTLDDSSATGEKIERTRFDISGDDIMGPDMGWRRKGVRICVTGGNWLVLLALFGLFNQFRFFDDTGKIDVTKPLQIDVDGCDVHFINGPEAAVTVQGSYLSQGYGGHYLDFDVEQDFVYGVYAHSLDCDMVPGFVCKSMCQISVVLPPSLPPGTSWGTISIRQLAIDVDAETGAKAYGFAVTAEPGVTIGANLKIVGANARVDLSSAKLGPFFISVAGPVALRNVSTVRNSSGTVITSKHSIFYSTSDTNTHHTANLRQPDGRYQVRTSGQVTVGELQTSPADRCSVGTAGALGKLTGVYDENNNGFVTVDEVRSTVTTKLPMCCSTNCPLALQADWQKALECDGLVSQFFPDLDSLPSAGRYHRLSSNDFVRAVEALNNTAFYPACTDSVTLQATDAFTGTTPIARALTLRAKAGDVIMEHHGAASGGGAANQADAVVAKAVPGSMRLDDGTAAHLRALANVYGNRNVAKPLYVVIYVHRGPWLPTETFVWSTRPIYLTHVNPAYLHLVGASSLLPEMQMVHARFTLGPEFYKGGIDLTQTVPQTGPDADLRADGLNITYRDMIQIQTYAALKTALTPLGQLRIKGELARIEAAPKWGQELKYWTLDGGWTVAGNGDLVYGSGDTSMLYSESADSDAVSPTIEARVQAQMDASIVLIGLAMTIAVILALTILVVLSAYLKTMIRVRHRDFKIMTQTASPLTDPNHARSSVDINSPWFIGFELPLEMLDILVPYRRFMYNGMRKFWTDRISTDVCTKSRVVDLSNDQRAIPYTDFIARYQMFCFSRRLRLEADAMKIRKFLLVGKHDTMLVNFDLNSLSELFTSPNELEARSAAREVTAPPISIKHGNVRSLVGIGVLADKIKAMANLISNKTEFHEIRLSKGHLSSVRAFFKGSVCPSVSEPRFALLLDVFAMNPGFRIKLEDKVENAKKTGNAISTLNFIHRRNFVVGLHENACQRRYALVEDLIMRQFGSADISAIQGGRVLKMFLVHCCSFDYNIESGRQAQHRPRASVDGDMRSNMQTSSSDYVLAAEFAEAMDVFREFCQLYELEDEYDIFASPDGLGTKAADGRWTMPVHGATIFETKKLTHPEMPSSRGEIQGEMSLQIYEDDRLNNFMEQLGVTQALRRRRYIVGAKWGEPTDSMSPIFIKEAVIDAFIQLLYVCAPGILIISVAYQAQLTFARTTGVVESKVVDFSNFASHGVMAKEQYFYWSYIWLTTMITGTAVLWAGITYATVIGKSRNLFSRVFYTCVGYVSAAYYLFFWFYASTAVLWQILVAVLNPDVNLVNGVVILTVVASMYAITVRMLGLRKRVLDAIDNNLDDVLNKNIARTWTTLQKSDKFLVENDEPIKSVTIENIFDAIDADEEGDDGFEKLDFNEFRKLFKFIGFEIDPVLEKSMFAFADVDGAGLISKSEFDRTWEYLREIIGEKVISRLHLTEGDIMLAIGFALVLFFITFPFLLLAIKLYSNQGTFTTVIHSMTIGVVGIFTSKRGAHDPAEEPSIIKRAIAFALADISKVAI